MRAVATHLGVAPNALYSHVGSKDELVDALLDDVLAAIGRPDPDEDPRAGLTAVMTATHELLLSRRDLVPLYLARQGSRGRNARALGASMEVLLERAGITGTDASAAVRVLVVHAIGSAAFVSDAGPLGVDDVRSTFAAGLGWLLQGIVT